MKRIYKKGTFAIKIVIICITAALIYFEKPFSLQQVSAFESASAEEKVLHLLEEPRHRTVHREGICTYLMSKSIQDTSFQHIHDQAILLTTIHTGRGPANGPVRSIPECIPLVHNVSNDGPGLL